MILLPRNCENITLRKKLQYSLLFYLFALSIDKAEDNCKKIFKMANVANQDDFENMTLINIGIRFKDDLDETIRWCRENGLLATATVCPTCDRRCNEQRSAGKVDGKIWRCTRCKKMISIRKGSFFEQSHLQLWQVLTKYFFKIKINILNIII